VTLGDGVAPGCGAAGASGIGGSSADGGVTTGVLRSNSERIARTASLTFASVSLR
jgi:hypothetical protein